MGYSAINVGYRDLTAGTDFLDSLRQSYDDCFISANIYNEKTNELLFAPYKIITLDAVDADRVFYNKLKIGVIGLTDSLRYGQFGHNDLIKATVKKPLPPAKALCKKLARRVDLLVLLFYGKQQTLNEILDACPDIDAALLGGEYYRALNVPVQQDKPLVSATPALGKYANFLQIEFDKNRKIVFQDVIKIALRDTVAADADISALKQAYKTKARELAGGR